MYEKLNKMDISYSKASKKARELGHEVVRPPEGRSPYISFKGERSYGVCILYHDDTKDTIKRRINYTPAEYIRWAKN